jgi:hypothetical protein
VDDQERQYLVSTIKDLERAKRRWKAVALAAILSAAFIFVFTGLSACRAPQFLGP